MDKPIKTQELYEFLEKVDKTFPTPLSEKQDLYLLSEKFCSKGTLCFCVENEQIVSLVAGYTENITDNMAYISVVATLNGYEGRGYAKKLVKEFISICEKRGIDAVHLYTAKTNSKAISMYKGIGFEEWKPGDEQRQGDLHLIYYVEVKN